MKAISIKSTIAAAATAASLLTSGIALQSIGGIPTGEMFRTFNMGVGFTAVVAEEDVEATLRAFDTSELTAVVIGRVVEGDRGVEIR